MIKKESKVFPDKPSSGKRKIKAEFAPITAEDLAARKSFISTLARRRGPNEQVPVNQPPLNN